MFVFSFIDVFLRIGYILKRFTSSNKIEWFYRIKIYINAIKIIKKNSIKSLKTLNVLFSIYFAKKNWYRGFFINSNHVYSTFYLFCQQKLLNGFDMHLSFYFHNIYIYNIWKYLRLVIHYCYLFFIAYYYNIYKKSFL